MDRVGKLAMIQKLDEETLTKKFVIPLFEAMGYKNIRYTHGILEFGRDVVCYKVDTFKDRIYTGVQVKKIKISKRDISEVLQQTLDAFSESFTNLSDGKEHELDRVIFLTSNEFTENAKKSLRNALKSANKGKLVKCIDGDRFVDLLDEYLPSAFWDQYKYFDKYLNTMKSAFETITDISAIGQKEPIPLEEIYVSLKLSEKLEKVKEREIDERIFEEEKKSDREIFEDEQLIREKREQIFDADAVTDKFDKVIIMGGPGSGKTTLLKHLTLKFCKKNLEMQERKSVPIFMTLRQFLESGKSVREYINEVFEQYNFPKAREFIEKDLKEGTCQLFLDGFDELASKERQKMVTDKIERFIREYPQNQVIVTSRTAGYHGELKGFETLEVLPFNDHQIEQFITNWFGEIDPEKAQAMGEAIKDNEKIKELASNPLMIAIIAIIYEEEKQLPQRRVKLYERCLEVLLSKWDIKKKIKNTYDAEAKEKILRKLALETHSQGGRSFTKAELLKKFIHYLPEVRIEPEWAEDVLNEIVQRNVLLKEVSIGVYEFLHLSFQEYLTALELWGKRDYQTLLDHLYEPWWEEVVLLFAGFDRDATDLILKIREKEKEDEQFREDIFHSNLILFGKCIADADYTNKEVKEEIVSDLWHLYENGEFPFMRERAMNILALIKPDSIIDPLIEALTDEDSHVRQSAAIGLGEIRSEKAVDPLIRALTDEDIYVRGNAAFALGRIGSEKAVDPLIEALTDEDSNIRQSAADALGRIGSEKAVVPLIKALTDEDSHVRASAAEALGRIGSEKAVVPLIEALTDEDDIVRRWSAEALGRIGSEKAVDPLIRALTDEDIYVRGNAAFALGRIGSEKAVDPLIRALTTDEDRSVRRSVAIGLLGIGSEKAVDPLIKALTDEDRGVRGNAAFALGRIGSEKAVDPLIEALTDEDSHVRASAAIGLGEIRSEKAVDLLIRAITDEDCYVRGNAAFALGRIGSEKAVDPLIRALTDEDRIFRQSAAEALEEISKKLKKRIIVKEKEI